MENNILESDDDSFDDDDEFNDYNFLPHKFENEVIGINSLSKCFEQRYDACPAFFMGSLQDACQEAFHPIIIQERRPILVYIHNDESLLSKTFCKTIFCSTIIIDYLLENYIVWPWDITFQSNRNTLSRIWKDIFSTEFFDDFSIEQCPLLIGIMRLLEDKTNTLIVSEYQYKSLLKDDPLTYTQMTVNREILLDELKIFKKLSDENELGLSFNFSKTTGFCSEIILQIVKYLSLNDAISTFSTDILPLLNDSKLKFQLSDLCSPFIKTIMRKFKPEQIVSLQINAIRLWSKNELNILSKFKNIIFITLLNLPYENQISQYEKYFPNLTCLSLCYDNEINFNMFNNIFNHLWKQIKRFEIHCAGTLCTHYDIIDQLTKMYMKNFTIKYFLFDIGHFPMNNCFRYYKSCFLITITNFIKKMINIQYVYLIINRYHIEQLLDIETWKILVNECFQLKKITLKVLESLFQDQQLIQKGLMIQTQLRNIRQVIKFQIIFS